MTIPDELKTANADEESPLPMKEIAAARTSAEGTLAALREAEIRLFADIADTLGDFGDGAANDKQRLLEISNDLRDMFFLVVVIGEFNAGKSSMVNALLGDALLPTGITPTTEAIELIKYGESRSLTPSLKDGEIREWTHPNTGAPGVALVDTPGTGSVFQRHERTAKSFLHRSDLVIFVISAKRALAETERLYLELAKSYGKKVVLVVNQADLLTPQERVEVRRFVERQVEELLDLKPLLFLISAKESLNSTSGVDTGGVDAIRAHLRGIFSSAPPARQKLIAQIDTVERMVRAYREQAREKVDLIKADRLRVRDVESELGQQSDGLNSQLKLARSAVDQIFEGIRLRGLNFLSQNMSLKKIGRGTNREKLQQEFQNTVIGNGITEIQDATQQYVNTLIDQSRLYWRSVIGRLNQLQETLESEISGLDASVYAEQREALQDAIRTAEAEMRSYSSGRVLSEMETTFRGNLNGFTMSAAASIAGVLATIAALAAPGPLLGGAAAAAPLAIPAFVVGAPVALVGGVIAYRYYRRISAGAKQSFNAQVDKIEQTYDQALDDLTRRERSRLTLYGKQVLLPIFSRLDTLAQRNEIQAHKLDEYLKELETLRRGIEQAG